MSQSTRYIDLDPNFQPHPVTRDVSRLFGDNAVKKSIVNLVRTTFQERLFQPAIGSNANNILFENDTPITRVLLEQSIEEVIRNYEKRASVQSVHVDVDDNDSTAYIVTIMFTILNQPNPYTVTFVLYRSR